MATDDLSKLTGEWYRQWEQSMAKWWDTVLDDPTFVKGMGENLAAHSKVRGQWEDGMDRTMEAMHLPTRKDLVRVRRLDVVSAYFSPPRTLRRQIAQVARRGKVRLMMAGKSDIDAAIDMARLLYKRLLAAGVRIFEFRPCKLHMKLLVADNASYVGSANLDKRSLRINVELMVRVEDAALAAKLRELIDHMEAASVPVTRDWYAREATFLARMRWRMAYWMSLADYRISQTGVR